MSPSTIISILIIISLLVFGFLGWKVFFAQSGQNVSEISTGYFKNAIGVGTKAPEYPLDVRGDVRWTGTLQGGTVPWQRISNFPGDCPNGQFVKGLGEQLFCETVPTGSNGTTNGTSNGATSWASLTNFPTGCPAGQFVQVIGSTLTCATPPSGGGGGGGGGVSGGGSANQIAKWTGAYSLGSSIIYDNGTNVGIGSNQPSTRLSILSNVDNILKLVRSGASSSYLWAIGTDGKLVLKDQENRVRFALESGGNIGIGTSSPGQKLEVAGYVKGTGFCIGSNCITNWPSGGTGGGSGDITGVSAGTGLSGGGTSGDVTLSADASYLQRRISSTCPSGSAIRVVNSDGTVTCESISGGGGGGTLGGSGTTGYLSRWLGATTLGNSGIFQSSDNFGIGTTSPAYKLDVGGYVKGTGFCIGSNCITSWPGGGGGGSGTVTSISQGNGITLSPNPITVNGTISLATQNCLSGQFVTGIGGTISCDTPSGGGGGGTVTSVSASGGITAFPNPITGTGSLSLAYPSKSCGAGSAIRSFDLSSASGPTCETVGGGGGGDITGVIAGSGLSGGGLSGDVTLNVGTGTGISVAADTVSVKNISFSCGAVNQSLKSLNIDTGAVTCETDDTGGGGGTLQCVEKGDNVDGGRGATVYCDSGYTPTGWAAGDYRVSANRVDTTSKYCAFYNWGTTRVGVYCICCRVQ